MRQHFDTWGIRGIEPGRLPAYAVPRDYETGIQAVCRAIERATGLLVATCRPDGHEQGRGQIVRDDYELTLGTRAPGGGYDVCARLWVGISR